MSLFSVTRFSRLGSQHGASTIHARTGSESVHFGAHFLQFLRREMAPFNSQCSAVLLLLLLPVRPVHRDSEGLARKGTEKGPSFPSSAYTTTDDGNCDGGAVASSDEQDGTIQSA